MTEFDCLYQRWLVRTTRLVLAAAAGTWHDWVGVKEEEWKEIGRKKLWKERRKSSFFHRRTKAGKGEKRKLVILLCHTRVDIITRLGQVRSG